MLAEKLRNLAIIAHVDHGKTTLVDGLLKQAQTFAPHQAEMQQTTIMDSNALEPSVLFFLSMSLFLFL